MTKCKFIDKKGIEMEFDSISKMAIFVDMNQFTLRKKLKIMSAQEIYDKLLKEDKLPNLFDGDSLASRRWIGIWMI